MVEPQTQLGQDLSHELDLKLSKENIREDTYEGLDLGSDKGHHEDILEDEKRPHDDSDSMLSPRGSVGPDDEITWRYLTFDTELPCPAYLTRSHTNLDGKPPPETPDLSKYTNPFLWARHRKHFMSWLGCIATTITAYTAGSYAVGEAQMTKEWHISEPAFGVGVTVFTCGFAVAPMFLAPFSEINGRRPVFVTAGFMFTMFQLTCALVPNFGGMLAARFLVGCASSTFSTMVGGVIADFYEAKDRNWAMTVFAGGAIFGTGLGPLCSGFIAQHLNWRWIFRVQAISCGMLSVIIFFFFKESRGSILLSRKAKALNKWYDQLESQGYYGMTMASVDQIEKDANPTSQRIRWKVKSDEERATLFKMIGISLYRPFHMLFTEPILFFFSLWITFAWACLYLLFSAIPLIFQTRHGFDVAQTGAVFSVISIGALISTIISVYQEPLGYRYLPNKWQPFLRTPEGRLMYCCVQSALLPIGSFWYGWSSFRDVPWIVPAIGIGIATMGVFSIYLAVFNYLADIYHIYASSALAAQSFCRNMAAGAFPVFVVQMFRKMTYQGAGSFLGGVSLALTVVPWILVFYGPRIRAKSKIARQLLEKQNQI